MFIDFGFIKPPMTMLKNYLLIAIRTFVRNRTTSFVNFLGLTIGLACSLLIFLHVNEELGYDRFHSKSNRIFRVLSIDNALGVSNNVVGITIPALAQAMKAEIPEVEDVVRIAWVGRNLVKYEENTFYAENTFLTDQSFLEVFDFELIEGDRKTCLVEPNSTIITKSMADKLFGDQNPMGKIFTAAGSNDLVVSGILKDETRPTHLKFDIVISLNPSPSDSTSAQFLNSWRSIAMVEYALLRDPARADEVVVQMDSLLRKNNVIEAWNATLQPLQKVHLYSGDILFDNFNNNKGNIRYVQSLSLIAIIILLIASFNYMNLSTARSVGRAREVGVRKTLGAYRQQLIGQHLSEAFLQILVSLIVAVLAVEILNHYLKIFSSTIFSSFIANPSLLAYLLILVFVLGGLSGLYPAIVLSSYKPQLVLKGRFGSGKKGLLLRRMLVSLQFIAAFVMISGTIVVINQVEYSLAKDKGFNASQIVNIRLDNRDLFEKYKTLEEELKKIPGIKMIAASSSMPGLGYGRRVIIPEGSQDTDTWITSVFSANENFIPLMEMEIVEGENFRENMSQQPSPVIVNQSLVKAAGWENGLNKTIKLGNGQEMQVIGVIKDFHFTSLRHSIEPIMISYRAGANGVVSLRVDESNMGQTIKSIEQAWKNVNGSIPFEYKYFDETLAYLFEKEKEFSMLFFRFTLLSIFIAVLGVFGLATYSAEQRTKEIGIRKTFGGTTKQMLMLQTNDYTMLILFAIVIGTPISIKLMSSWLEGFEYRISLDSTPFILASILSLVVTISTVSIQSFRAAQMNPTESLKYE